MHRRHWTVPRWRKGSKPREEAVGVKPGLYHARARSQRGQHRGIEPMSMKQRQDI